MTIACIDVAYTEDEAGNTSGQAACVVINDWPDARPVTEHIVTIDQVADYQPGEFYRRELPCIHAVLAELPPEAGPPDFIVPDFIVIDGYVWLDDQNTPGLGAYLYQALGKTTCVIGVAKNPYKQSKHATELCRGDSVRPLYITAAGIPVDKAAELVASMHGKHRFPTILKLVDQRSRQD
jgi:deoxyribonuclease V